MKGWFPRVALAGGIDVAAAVAIPHQTLWQSLFIGWVAYMLASAYVDSFLRADD